MKRTLCRNHPDPEIENFSVGLVRAELSGVITIAVSLANDDDDQAMAKSYSAKTLLDTIRLYND